MDQFDLKTTRKIMKAAKINPKFIKPKMLAYALNVENEHRDLTGGDPSQTLHIVIAHLMEYPDYYKRLAKMEKQADKYWTGKKREPLFLD